MSTMERLIGRRQADNIQAYRDTFESPQGKKVLLNLISTHGVMTSTFDKDPQLAAFKEGERNVVLRILSLLKADPQQIRNLIRESDDALQITE